MSYPLFQQKTVSTPLRLFFCAAILLLDIGLRSARYALVEYQSRDGYRYVSFAENLAAAKKLPVTPRTPAEKEVFCKPPLLVGVMVLGEKYGTGAAESGIVLVFLCGILLPVVLAGIAHELFGDWRCTLGTMLLASVLPPLVRYSVLLLRDMPYWFFCAVSVWFAVRAERKQSWSCWCGFAVAAALATCTRREGFELILAWGLWLLCSGWHIREFAKTLRHKCCTGCCVLIPYLTLVLSVQKIWHDCGSSWQVLPLNALGFYWSRLI